ncbi:hypothetical protein BJ170DRAFT_614730 [Xylariales sp. AK1849]|nr:hypothetical protein BJ170DRAFT_614730 [Xylariales sp. AK1849]
MELSFATLDVFTTKRLEGNPLAVVSVPAFLKEKLSQDTKQKITQEFNLSETVFLHESTDEEPSELNVDIFCVESELPFAGHPTIGTAVLAKHHLYPSVEKLITKAGPIGLSTVEGSTGFVRAAIPHNVHLHRNTLASVIPPEQHANHPGLSHHAPAIREAELHAPVFSIVKGMTFVLVKLPSLDLLGQVRFGRLDFDDLPAPLLDPEWSPSFRCRYYYVDGGTSTGGDDGEEARNIRSRMVDLGVEDPATGAGASALTAYLTVAEKSENANFVIVQGVEMGRRSVIHVRTAGNVDGAGKVKLENLWLGGQAVVVQKGTIRIN